MNFVLRFIAGIRRFFARLLGKRERDVVMPMYKAALPRPSLLDMLPWFYKPYAIMTAKSGRKKNGPVVRHVLQGSHFGTFSPIKPYDYRGRNVTQGRRAL
jgi:hypothetical protein